MTDPQEKCNHEPVNEEGHGAGYTFCKHCGKEWTKEMELTDVQYWKHRALTAEGKLAKFKQVGKVDYSFISRVFWLPRMPPDKTILYARVNP